MAEVAGRSCPLEYRYGAAALARPATLQAETLWIAGGLYGNREALERLLELYEGEPGSKALVFNGDFHWFDAAREDFQRIQQGVLAHPATRGNVETELALPHAGAGCGCAYPDWVGDAEVGRSNRILERLRATAAGAPAAVQQLGELPMTLVAEVGSARIGIVHGDADSLAGWGFSQQRLATASGWSAARAAFDAAGVRVFASSHTCLPVLQAIDEARVVVNNGAAGMPNFTGTQFGVATRISLCPRADALYRLRCGPLEVEAHAIAYDAAGWRARFLESWPEGSDAHASYFSRIANGPRYSIDSAFRPAARRAA